MLLLWIKKNKILFARENTPHKTRRILKNLYHGGKKLATWNKGSWFYHDVFRAEIERNIKGKIIRPKDDFDFQNDSDSDNGIYSGSNHLPYVVVDLKLLEIALTKIARWHDVAPKYLSNKI